MGNVLSFSVTVALAHRVGASVFLRIDDLDRDRVERKYVEDIFDTLRFLEIPWDEGPADILAFEREYSQLHRMGIYERALNVLADSGSVFACTCSRAQLVGGVYSGTCRDRGLPLDTEGANWRLRTCSSAVVRVKTWAGGEIEAVLPAEMQDFVVRKKDGFPAYQLTSLVDDVHFGVDGIVRGEDLWASTLAQQYLAGILPGMTAFREATFYHHPLLKTAEGEKLSKSAGATSIQYMRRQGMNAADIYSSIARLLGKDVAVSGKDAPVSGWEGLAALVV